MIERLQLRGKGAQKQDLVSKFCERTAQATVIARLIGVMQDEYDEAYCVRFNLDNINDYDDDQMTE